MMTSLWKLVQYEFRRFKGRSKLGLFFVLIIPLLYGGIYLHANWNLYGNTSKVPIAVVNLDQPVTYDGKTVAGGDELEKNLKQRPVFGWQFVGKDEAGAMRDLHDGRYYMVITVPKDFSHNLVGASSYNPARATLKLHRDDANGFIIGLLTSQVENSVGRALDESVTQTYFEAVFTNLGQVKQALGQASDGAAQVAAGNKMVNDGVTVMNTKVLDATKSLGESQQAVNSINGALDDVDAASSKLSTAVGQARTGATTVASSIQDVGEDGKVVNSQTSQLVQSITQDLPQWQRQARNLVTATGKLENPNGETVTTIQTNVSGATERATKLLASHPELAKDADYVALVRSLNVAGSATTTVSSNIAVVGSASAGLNLSLNQSRAQQTADNVSTALDRLNKDISAASTGVDQMKGALATADSGVKDLDSGVHKATSAGRTVTAKVPSAIAGVVELSNGLGQLKKGTDTLTSGATELSDKLSAGYQKMPSLSPANSQDMSKIMSSPVDVEQTVDHPATYYGRGLAPMFFSIAMWIACISTFLVVRTFSGRALAGRANSLKLLLTGYGPAAIVALTGSLLMALGVWFALGLDPVHPWLFLLFVVVTCLAWMAMAHGLRMVFGSPQTAIFLILLVLQLPTCGGTFPVAMLPTIYRKLSVIMPMKYAVDAFRIVISGGPMSNFVIALAVQVGILALSLLGIAILVHRHKRFRMRDLHPPMVTSTSTADFAFSVRPR
ncbi:YhgE/Pip domain-containing protein [Acidipropionibacterium timonense]|uniref:YhgE/Pip domain-containing protein n=1 Tax=Acidipropionibacterium timonense TaxID=2161818 RepID=UPI00103175C1|nr:YhgE/Pip domain-containing protein [Acidipropionibacterium timonense]